MLAPIRSAAVLGIDAYLVDVETDIANGLPSFATVGLPHGAVKEGRERVGAAVANSGFSFPLKRITVNLAPADVRKEGSAFDLPIALGVLAATEQLAASPGPLLDDYVIVGELGLEGGVRPVRGALPVALVAKAGGLRGVIVPLANLAEAGGVGAPGLGVGGGRVAPPACPRNRLCRDVLFGLYCAGHDDYDALLADPRTGLTTRAMLLALDPRNVTLEPE